MPGPTTRRLGAVEPLYLATVAGVRALDLTDQVASWSRAKALA